MNKITEQNYIKDIEFYRAAMGTEKNEAIRLIYADNYYTLLNELHKEKQGSS